MAEGDNGNRRLTLGVIAAQGALNVAMLGWLFVLAGQMNDRFTGTQGSTLLADLSVMRSNQHEVMRRVSLLEGREPVSQEVLRRLLSIEVTTRELARELYKISGVSDTALARMEERVKQLEEIGVKRSSGEQRMP